MPIQSVFMSQKSQREIHGGSYSPEYRIWKNILCRCYYPSHNAYPYYGGRTENPVTVCEEWRQSFATFLAYVGKKPTPLHTLDRIENEKGYEPGNVRWATRKEQGRNTKRKRLLTYNGETKPIWQWSEETGLGYQLLFNRIDRGWTAEKALTTPEDETKGKIRFVVAFGHKKPMSEWAREYGLGLSTLKNRLNRGIAPEEALTMANLRPKR
jgi:hypothetical protein